MVLLSGKKVLYTAGDQLQHAWPGGVQQFNDKQHYNSKKKLPAGIYIITVKDHNNT